MWVVAENTSEAAVVLPAELKLVHAKADSRPGKVRHHAVEETVGENPAVVFDVAAHLIVLVADAGRKKFRFRIQKQSRRLGGRSADHNHAGCDFRPLVVPGLLVNHAIGTPAVHRDLARESLWITRPRPVRIASGITVASVDDLAPVSQPNPLQKEQPWQAGRPR